jgi:hypothetical protein
LVGKEVLEEDDVSHLEPEELKYHRTLARLYARLEPILDKTWRWNDIELVK